jgi:hypothetical protein
VRSGDVDGVRREELWRLLDADLFRDSPHRRAEPLCRGLGLEHVKDVEAVRAFPGRMNQEAVKRKV